MKDAAGPRSVDLASVARDVITRRRTLRAFAGLGLGAVLPLRAAVAAAGEAVPACVARPEQTEGPFFVDRRRERSDIRTDPATGVASAGAPLALALRVSRLTASRCEPWRGAHVDVWQCDAAGAYSGVSDRRGTTAGQGFLRGYQVTDDTGLARFVTIYPGAYPGRAVHVHFKIRSGPQETRGYEFTSQLYFDDRLTDRVHARAPYVARRRTRNGEDGLFRAGGESLLLDVVERGEGFAAEFPIALAV